MLTNICQNVEYLSYEHTLQFFSMATEHAAHIFEGQQASRNFLLFASDKIRRFPLPKIQLIDIK
jgi:hypothetical protein